MALLSAPAACVYRQQPIRYDSPVPKLINMLTFSLRLQTCRSIPPIRCSTETSSSEPSATQEENASESAAVTQGENPSEIPAETLKPFSSLISAGNVEKALRGIAITDADHYGRLGIPRGASYDQAAFGCGGRLGCESSLLSRQTPLLYPGHSFAHHNKHLVRIAYKSKCEELMNQGLNDEGVSKELQESYLILSSEDERRLYDWSLARSEGPDRYVWPFEVDITQTPTEPPPPREPEDVGPTRLVGYFFLAWLILSFALSVTLNR